MIKKINDIYEKVSQTHNLQYDLVKSIGDCVFDELVDKMCSFKDLSYELPKLGVFNLRFKKFENYYLNFIKKLEQNDPDCLKKLEENRELFENNTRLYNKILEYRELKKNKRSLRYENQTNESSEN